MVRRSRLATPLVPLVAVAALLPGCSGGGGDRGSVGGDQLVRVERVVDGDTIVVRTANGTDRVRYIGVDTPESVKPDTPVQCWGKKASALNRSMVEGRRVKLRYDRERRDRYGRLLAYVSREDGLDVNAALISAGAARTLEISPNTSRAGRFRALERKARSERRGMWGECPASQGAGGSLVLFSG